MILIQEPDFIIAREGGCLRLKIPKSKSELKEEDPYNILGYYTTLLGALNGALEFRHGKKYKGGQSVEELVQQIKEYKSLRKKLSDFSKLIYNPILKYKKELFVYEEKKLNYWKI